MWREPPRMSNEEKDMNPLSPLTYYRRHKRRAALLVSLIMLVTTGLYLMVALVWGAFVEPARLSYMALTKFSQVTPESDENGPDPAVVARIRANPDVAKVIPTSAIIIQLPSVVPGEAVEFELHGLMEEDMPYVLERCGATLKEGQLPEPGTNGFLLSEDVAAILGLRVGDRYDAINSETHANVDAPLKATSLEVVGILESGIRLGLVSLEFLNSHELYRNLPARFLVVAREDRDAAVDDFLRSEIQTSRTEVRTLTRLHERIRAEALPALVLLLPATLIVTIAFSLVIVVVNRIANARRLQEYGILNATGLSKRWLIRRLTMETTTLAAVGWAMGMCLC
jgi:ABC-type lipoprotein release transport system permease subunit